MVKYLAGPEVGQEQVIEIAEVMGCGRPVPIVRRGTPLGWIANDSQDAEYDLATMQKRWEGADGIFLPAFFRDQLDEFKEPINESIGLMNDILDDEDVSELLDASYYRSRLSPKFELLPGSYDESDPQEIVKLDADALDGDEVTADDLWLKFSWLSFEDDDLSLRCRVSFGLEGYEDVAADWQKQQLAADLTEAVFPESALISNSKAMQKLLSDIMRVNKIAYVERIIYFNAPNGGAQFHQDVERGHTGVVFAQLYGSTAWLTMSKETLMDELIAHYSESAGREFIAEGDWPDDVKVSFFSALKDRTKLADMMECHDNDALEHALNRNPDFFKRLVEAGYANILQPGDVILLPQKSIEECAWHTVFCADDFAGHALSFAIREVPEE